MLYGKPIIITKKKPEDEKRKAKIASLEEAPAFVDRDTALAIRSARAKAELSQKKLGLQMSVNASVIADWENQKAVYDEKIARKFEKALSIKLVPKE
jgi:putative transcription factor